MRQFVALRDVQRTLSWKKPGSIIDSSWLDFYKSFNYTILLLSTAIEKKKIYLYEMQIRPWHARKNNSLAAYMDLNHTVSVHVYINEI